MTATVLTPDCLRTTTVTEFCPLSRESDRGSSTLSPTRATSRRKIGCPPELPTMISLKSLTAVIRPRVRTTARHCPAPPSPPAIPGFFVPAPRPHLQWSSRERVIDRYQPPPARRGSVHRRC